MQLSDPTGLYEVTVFSDTLEAARDVLEAGQNVVLTVEAHLEGETLKLLARGAQPIDQVAAQAGGASLRIYLEGAGAVASVASILGRLEPGRTKGQVIICITDPDLGQEIDMVLPQDYPITPQVKGAIKAVGGVLLVEEV